MMPSPQQAHLGAGPPAAREHNGCINVRRVRLALHTRRHQSRKQDCTNTPAFGAKWGNEMPTWYFQDQQQTIPRRGLLGDGVDSLVMVCDRARELAIMR